MRLNIGCGTTSLPGFLGVDRHPPADVICDLDREPLPFPDDSVDEIAAYEVLEHVSDLIRVMNELWRVLKPEGILRGKVPGTRAGALADPTHRRVFVVETFDYFTGQSAEDPWRPARPRHADYGIKPWYRISVDNGIRFTLRPRKTERYDPRMERE